MNTLQHGDEFTRNGLNFRVEFEPDHFAGAPWENEDGHGPITDWQNVSHWWSNGSREVYRPKPAGWRLLCQDGRMARFYDFAEAIKRAKREGWGLGPNALAELRGKLGRDPTAGEIRAAAVERDFDRLRRWCADDWYYVGCVVTLLDVDGCATDESESLWGIESDSDDYLTEVAHEMADDIAKRVGDAAEIPARVTTFIIRA